MSNKTKSEHQSAQAQTKHLIFGAGLIGCYIGGALLHVKQNVSFVGRKRFLTQLEGQYTLSDFEGNRVTVSHDAALIDLAQNTDLPQADVIWLTVKCTMLSEAISEMRPCVGDKTVIICCQNGVNTHQEVELAFPHNHVIRAMVPFNVVNDDDKVFHRGSEGKMIIEIASALESSTKWLSRQLSTPILPLGISYHMTALQWAKLQLNMGNAVNALADVPVKQMLETRIYRRFIARLMRELLLVTEKQKIKLPKIANLPNTWIPKVLTLPDWLFKLLAQKMIAVDPKVKTSMWWDLSQNRQTEVDFIQGKVVSEAKRLDVPAPANEWTVSLIHRAEKGERMSAEQFKSALEQFELEQDT
ncbi:2-dehydropantoate 2-reductase [Ningiella sp. W23]|uniref:2-dehydropantoate 2-reductase n=1 Tax=Ningiella sp. W23 TaxID=3023715 RepID=UPI003758051E